MNNERAEALAAHLRIDIDEVEETTYDDQSFEADGGEYRVLTDCEADQAWSDSIDSYIEDCVLPEMPEHLQNYFDHDSFKRDCEFDGRGHSLNGYDGSEEEERINGTWYYIYRTN